MIRRLCFLGLLCLATLLSAATPRLRNGGFEEPNLKNWAIFYHGQESFVKIGTDAVDYVEGLHSAKITVGETPRVYVGMNQHFDLQKGERWIDVSLSYRSPNAHLDFFLFFSGAKNLKYFCKTLPKSEDWTKVEFRAEIPSGATAGQAEFRVSRKGTFLVDNVVLKFRKGDDVADVTDLLFVNSPKISNVFAAGLRRAGFSRINFCDWSELTPEKLKNTRCVTVFPLEKLTITKADEEIITLLKEYVRNGGGLLLTQCYAQWFGNTILPNRLGDEFGAKIRYEVTIFPKDKMVLLGNQEGDKYAETTEVFPPVNNGIKSVLVSANPYLSLVGAVPFDCDDNWKVVLRGGKGSHGQLISDWGLEIYQQRVNGLKAFTDNVPLAGVRNFGQGRVGYLGLNPSCTLTMDDSGKHGAAIATRVFVQGNLLKLMTNFYAYLSANTAKLAAAKLPAVSQQSEAYGTPRIYRGVIGARTTFSSGTSTPAEYAAAARKAGLDFIVFLEDFDHLSHADFEKLRKECANLTTRDFVALPGFTYKNVDGNNQYIYGNLPVYPGDKLLDQSRKRFKTVIPGPVTDQGGDLYYTFSMLSFQSNSGWYNFAQNPYPYYDMRSVCTMGVITQENGKTIDSALAAYADTNRSVQYIWPQALTLMRNASEIDLVKDGRYFHNELYAQDFKQLEEMLSSRRSRMSRNRYPGVPCFGKMSVTQGPTLTLDMPRGDMNPGGDLYSTVLNYWPLELKAAAPDGIKTIELWDGDTLLKRFHPNGQKEFAYNSALPNDRQRHIWAKLESVTGKTAFTRSVSSDSWLMRDYYCMDRNNPLLYSLQYRKDGSQYLITYAADGVHPWKGPWIGRIRPLGPFVSDPKLGVGKLRYDGSPEAHPQLAMIPKFFKNGEVGPNYPKHSWQGAMVPDAEGGVHNRPSNVLFSSNVMIARQELDGVFPLGAYPIIHTHSSLFPFKKSEYLESAATRTLYLIKPDGVSSWLWEQDFKILKSYPVSANGNFLAAGSVARHGADLGTGMVNGKKVNLTGKIKLHKGDFLCYQGNFFGTLAVYILSDGLTLDGDRFVFCSDQKEVPAGTELDLKMVFAGINRLEKDPFALAAKFGRDFGLTAPGKTGYSVDLKRGKVLSNEYTLQLLGPVEGTIRGIDALPANLGTKITGMRDNCAVLLACAGKKRILPVEKGAAYAVLTEQENNQPLVIGHPMWTENPAITMTLSSDSTYLKWRAEFQNPTEKSVTTRLLSDPALTGKSLNETITLAPGETLVREF